MKTGSLLQLNTDYTKRVYGLDVFRAVAIISVVMGHGGFLLNKALPGFPYIKLIDGVELFFVLSGFLIGSMLIKIYERNGTLNASQVFSFWKRRWFRTLPNYYLILFLNVALIASGITTGNLDYFNWKFLVFLQNFNTHFTDFFWESWSLTIEEWFYIFTPLSIWLLHKIFKNSLAGKQIILGVLLLFIVLPLFYRISISGEELDYFWYDVKFRKVVVTRLDAIMYGVLFAWTKYYYPAAWKRIAIPFFVLGLVLIYVTMYYHAGNPTGLFGKTIYFSLVGISAAMLLPFADSVKQFKTGFGKVMTHISLVSYSMYLINLCIVAAIIEKNFMPVSAAGGLVTYIIFWVAVIIFSTLIYKYFEKPVMDLRERSTRKTEI